MVTMTDKQIIIDGIDVGGCIYYEDGKCLNGEMVQCNCKKVAVCYYKEYKRKEQECEELKGLLKVRIEDLCDSCGASSMMPMTCKVYEKTLTDIKEIMKKHCRKCKKT